LPPGRRSLGDPEYEQPGGGERKGSCRGITCDNHDFSDWELAGNCAPGGREMLHLKPSLLSLRGQSMNSFQRNTMGQVMIRYLPKKKVQEFKSIVTLKVGQSVFRRCYIYTSLWGSDAIVMAVVGGEHFQEIIGSARQQRRE